LFEAITLYFTRYKGSFIRSRDLRILLKKAVKEPEILTECHRYIGIIKRMKFEDEELIYDTVVSFAQSQSVKQLLLEVVPMLDNKQVNLLDIRNKLDAVIMLDDRLKTKQLEFLDYEVGQVEEEPITQDAIPTMLGNLDDYISGGLGRGELGIILGPPGRGKTLTLINLGAKALLQGLRVIHFTLEISDRKVARRYDARLTGTPMGDPKPDSNRPLQRVRDVVKGKLVIKDYIDSSPQMSELRNFISKMILTKFKYGVDLVIVDYADLMAPERKFKEKRFELAELYASLRRLGNEFKCAVWTASQSTRQSIGKSKIGLIDFAEDIQKAAIADLVIGLCQTPEEETEGIMRAFLAKNRRGSGKPTLRFRCKPNMMLLSPWTG
jgi:replicative DNA helicase